MEIKNLNLGEGLKKNKKWNIVKTTGAALVLASLITTPAYAYVPQNDFIGEAEYSDIYNQDRIETKQIETQT